VAEVVDPIEQQARARYLDIRAIKGSDYVVPDHVFYGPRQEPKKP